MNADIKEITKWTTKPGLKLHTIKTKSLIIVYSRFLNTINTDNVQNVVDGTVVPYRDLVNSLGLTINKTMDWADYVIHTFCRVFSRMHTPSTCQGFCHPYKNINSNTNSSAQIIFSRDYILSLLVLSQRCAIYLDY